MLVTIPSRDEVEALQARLRAPAPDARAPVLWDRVTRAHAAEVLGVLLDEVERLQQVSGIERCCMNGEEKR